MEHSKPLDVLIAGIPRSGTTLTCWLINQLPESVALAEPMDVMKLIHAPGPDARLKNIEDFLRKVRSLALEGQPLPGKVVEGGGSNFFHSRTGGHRQTAIAPSHSTFLNKALRSDFLLAVKHPNAFTALLPTLVERFKCFATIRNPLSVLASWETIEAAVNRGHAPIAEALHPDLSAKLNRISDQIERQLALLDWYYRTFASALPQSSIIRYEDLVESNGRALSEIIPSATGLPEILRKPLANRNKNVIYDNGILIDRYARALLARKEHACWQFYVESEIVQVLEATRDRRR